MNNFNNLQGKILLAMPTLKDIFFERSVCYICQHDDQGTIGLVINHPLEMLERDLLTDQGLDINIKDDFERAVLRGGPVHTDRGFVIHQSGNSWHSSTQVDTNIFVTTSHDVLEAIANREIRDNYLLALGYAAWEEDQLLQELADNTWLIADINTTDSLLFQIPFNQRWEFAMHQLGIHNLAQLSSLEGHA